MLLKLFTVKDQFCFVFNSYLLPTDTFVKGNKNELLEKGLKNDQQKRTQNSIDKILSPKC